MNGFAPIGRLRVHDPTRLDPPIEISITVAIFDEAMRRALRHLSRLHGWPEGVAPIEVQATPEHQAAEATLLRAHPVRILVTAIDAEGRPTFELAPRDA